MKMIHTYYPTKRGSTMNKSLMYMMTLSFLLLKRFYGYVVLYTDEDTKKLVEGIGLNYDEINIDLLKGLDVDTFSIPKLIVYANQTEPFIHIDLDSFIYDRISFETFGEIVGCFPEGIGDVLNLDTSNVSYFNTYIKNTFEINDKLPPEFLKHVQFNNIPNMSIFGGRDVTTISNAAKYCLGIYEKNKDFFDGDYSRASVIEQLFMLGAIKMYKYQGDNYKGLYCDFIFKENPIGINFEEGKTNEYPFEIQNYETKKFIQNDEELFKYVMYSFNGFLHVNGYKNFDKLTFLIKQRILIDFNGEEYIERIEKNFSESREYDILTEKYKKHITEFTDKITYDQLKVTPSKIICSLEEWDSIIDYYRPNGSSKTWYINELKRISRPLMWGDWNLITEQGEMFNNNILKGLVTTEYSKRIEYTPIEHIKDKHIYVITVWNVNFFKENYEIGFSCITKKYLQDIREGKSKIVMLHLYEGYSGSKDNDDLEIIEKWRIDSNLPVDSIYYVSGNLLCEELVKNKKLGFQGRSTNAFEPWNKYETSNGLVEFNPIDTKDLFLNYNRNPRHQRIFLLSELLKDNLFDRGRISLNRLIHSDPLNVDATTLDYFKNNTPFTIDREYNLDFNLAIDITIEDYEKTFISLVSESLVDEDSLFITEKTFKPILVGHPFIIFGNQYTLRHLKNLRYKTFDRWIDESYDEEPNYEKRALMIVNEIKKLSTKSNDELKQIREEMKEVCIFNQSRFRKLYEEKYNQDNLNIEITKIFDDVWNELTLN